MIRGPFGHVLEYSQSKARRVVDVKQEVANNGHAESSPSGWRTTLNCVLLTLEALIAKRGWV